MKFTITFKTPGALDDLDASRKLSPDDLERAKALVEKYVRWGEYLSVEFDIEDGTATVLKAK